MNPSDADDKMIQRFFAEDIDPELVEEFEAWLRADPSRAKLLAEHGLMEQLMVSVQQEADASAVMQLLLEQEQAAEPIDLISEIAAEHVDHQDDPGALSAHDFAAAGGYLLRKVLTSRAAIYAFAASIILLVGVVLLPWGGNNEQDPEPYAGLPEDQPDKAVYVATLTSERDAQWAEGVLATGSALAQGQRLTLTQGYAEITTRRGAVAMLEAPCTVELIDSPNAIYLHAGKMVGICETDTSKGFLVRTPHMDVTDLGTRFGVDLSELGKAEVHVYEGEVEVSAPNPDNDNTPIRRSIVQGQALRLNAGEAELVSIKPDFARFAGGLGAYRLPGTAATIHRGAKTDGEWRLIAVNEERLETPQPLLIKKPGSASVMTRNKPGVARWLQIQDAQTLQGDRDATFTVSTNVILPKDVDLDRAVLHIDFHADDRLESINFNGRPYADWKQVATHVRRGKGSAQIPLRDVLVSHGINGVNLKVRNVAGTEAFLYVAWEIRQNVLPTPTN